jgi:hypothetical protein
VESVRFSQNPKTECSGSSSSCVLGEGVTLPTVGNFLAVNRTAEKKLLRRRHWRSLDAFDDVHNPTGIADPNAASR